MNDPESAIDLLSIFKLCTMILSMIHKYFIKHSLFISLYVEYLAIINTNNT